jgi:hypothetical protein
MTPPATTRTAWHKAEPQSYDLRLTFAELSLIYKSLQAVKSLDALLPQDELLNDTLHLVDQALNLAV